MAVVLFFFILHGLHAHSQPKGTDTLAQTSSKGRSKKRKDATIMEGSSATTAQPTMDATTAAMDVSTPTTISPAVLNDAVSENVKNIKRKVISVSKLMEIFKNKESGAYYIHTPWKDLKATKTTKVHFIYNRRLTRFISLFIDMD